MLAAIAMYAHGQRGSSQRAKYGKGRCAPSQTIEQDSVSATDNPTSVRVWNRLMLLILCRRQRTNALTLDASG